MTMASSGNDPFSLLLHAIGMDLTRYHSTQLLFVLGQNTNAIKFSKSKIEEIKDCECPGLEILETLREKFPAEEHFRQYLSATLTEVKLIELAERVDNFSSVIQETSADQFDASQSLSVQSLNATDSDEGAGEDEEYELKKPLDDEGDTHMMTLQGNEAPITSPFPSQMDNKLHTDSSGSVAGPDGWDLVEASEISPQQESMMNADAMDLGKNARGEGRSDKTTDSRHCDNDPKSKSRTDAEKIETSPSQVIEKQVAPTTAKGSQKSGRLAALGKLKGKFTAKQSNKLSMRGYQRELAEPGIAGRNCIICAPTGSGKTMTAGCICTERRQHFIDQEKPFKALFVVCIRNLILQQTNALKEIIHEKNVVAGVHETDMLDDMLEKHEVIVLTAQILVNVLKSNDLKITDFDLIILDECHHTNLNHPYNVLMQFYRDAKQSDCTIRLPQIIGLTASLGVGSRKEATRRSMKKDPEEDALEHYILLCANMDCLHITHVRNEENMTELLKHNPPADQKQIKSVPPRSDDDIGIQVFTYLMEEIEGMSRIFAAPRIKKGSQDYEGWIVKERQAAERKECQADIFLSETLEKLNKVLMYYDGLQAQEVLPELFPWFFSSGPIEHRTKEESTVYELFQEVYEGMDAFAEEESLSDNPKLDELTKLLQELYEKERDARGIILTRTRFNVIGLVDFIKRQQSLKDIVLPAKFVGQGKGDGTMSDKDQENTIRRFSADKKNQGRVNLLVATDVAQEGLDMPKCNFVIRYDFVSNEIGAVQSRGRARAKQSECYLIVTEGSINLKRELKNLQKEHIMQKTLTNIDKIKHEELERRIAAKQQQVWDKYVEEQSRKKIRKTTYNVNEINIHCKHCKTFLCAAADMRNKGNQYIACAADIADRVWFQELTHEDFRYDTQIGTIHCKECMRFLGNKKTYKCSTRREGYVIGKDGVVWKKPGREFQQIKQWSKVEFTIEEEDMFD